jgi:hypothetical protein
MSSKKNLTGGKVFRKLGSGENHKHVKNRLIAESFVDDVLSKTPTEGVTLAKVLKVLGGARMQLQTLSGDTVVAMMRGNLRCSKGASKHADNPIMATVGTFVLLQTEDFGLQIISVMGRKHVNTLQTALKDVAARDFFVTAERDEGFDWDEGEEDTAEAQKTTVDSAPVNIDDI